MAEQLTMSPGKGGIKRVIGMNGELAQGEPAGVSNGPVGRNVETAMVKLDVVVRTQTQQIC
ncbi:hypothetical protein ASG41_12545 [Modestobacter sp. Leaf380]|nr:hypothetical protein ASG41_12545 [Modestobacter sp. Leaf380]